MPTHVTGRSKDVGAVKRKKRQSQNETNLAVSSPVPRDATSEEDWSDVPTATKPAKKRVRTSQRPSTSQSSGQDRRSASSSDGSLGADVFADARKLPRLLYRWLKYPLYLYGIIWLLNWSIAYSFRQIERTIDETTRKAMMPICRVPLISSTSICAGDGRLPTPTLNLTKTTSAQEHFTDIMIPSIQNRDLAGAMNDREHAVRNLRIRVAHSELQRKQEIAEQLEQLALRTKDTARALSRFSAKVTKSVDAVVTIDRHSVKKLESAIDRASKPPSFANTVIQAFNPIALFTDPSLETQDQMKKEFMYITSRMARELSPLNRAAFELDSNLEDIKGILDRIAELSLDEFGDLPRMQLLSKIWTQLARPDDYAEYQSHKTLLDDLLVFYWAASGTVKETVETLRDVDAEVSEFRDEYAKPALVGHDQPVEVAVGLLKGAIERLEYGRRGMRRETPGPGIGS